MRYFTTTHEWFDDSTGEVGISDYGIKEMGDIVFVELPKISSVVKGGVEVCVVESTKAATDIHSPISGTIIEVNSELQKDPSQLNKAGTWLYKIKPSDTQELSSLKSQVEYDQLTGK